MFNSLRNFFGVAFAAIFFSTTALADLPLADGGPSGQWWNPVRNGEGLFVEILPDSRIAIAWFTYDGAGNQMWLTGQAELGPEDTAVVVSVTVTDGPFFGPDYNAADVNFETWGTVGLQFYTCDTGILTYTSSVGMGEGAIDISRISSIKTVNCEEPPGTDQLIPGEWKATGTCIFVSEDGRTITSEGSPCPGGAAFWLEAGGVKIVPGNAFEPCEVKNSCMGTFAIQSDGNFECGGPNGFSGGFFDVAEQHADGGAADRSGSNNWCLADWAADAP